MSRSGAPAPESQRLQDDPPLSRETVTPRLGPQPMSGTPPMGLSGGRQGAAITRSAAPSNVRLTPRDCVAHAGSGSVSAMEEKRHVALLRLEEIAEELDEEQPEIAERIRNAVERLDGAFRARRRGHRERTAMAIKAAYSRK